MDFNTLDYRIKEWQENSKRHLELSLSYRLVPYVRQTRRSRFRRDPYGQRAREYCDNQAEIRDAVKLIMIKENIQPFINTRLGFQSSFWLAPKKVMRVKKEGTVDNPQVIDLSNLEKACEDALQGVVFNNDKYIWERGAGAKYLGKWDRFLVHIWEL